MSGPENDTARAPGSPTAGSGCVTCGRLLLAALLALAILLRLLRRARREPGELLAHHVAERRARRAGGVALRLGDLLGAVRRLHREADLALRAVDDDDLGLHLLAGL